jgi:hypothetical protein
MQNKSGLQNKDYADSEIFIDSSNFSHQEDESDCSKSESYSSPSVALRPAILDDEKCGSLVNKPDLLRQKEIRKQRMERNARKPTKVKIDVGEGLALIAQSMAAQSNSQPVMDTRVETKLDGLTDAISKQTEIMMALLQQMQKKD